MYLQPRTKRGVWFHELPPLATISRAIVATDAGTTPAGMAMALAYDHAPWRYRSVVASGVETSQEGEALTLLLCARQLAAQQGVYWVVPDSDSVVGTLCTYHAGGHCSDGIHHLYAQTISAERLAPRAAINIMVTPSHWITAINVRVYAATREEPQADLTWTIPYHTTLCIPYHTIQYGAVEYPHCTGWCSMVCIPQHATPSLVHFHREKGIRDGRTPFDKYGHINCVDCVKIETETFWSATVVYKL